MPNKKYDSNNQDDSNKNGFFKNFFSKFSNFSNLFKNKNKNKNKKTFFIPPPPFLLFENNDKKQEQSGGGTNDIETENEKLFKTIDTNITLLKKNQDNKLLSKYHKDINNILDNDENDNIKLYKLTDIVSDIEGNDALSINNLKISKEDRLIFIVITFIIRLISLTIVDWSLNTNFIYNISQAFILYIVLYIIFYCIIIIIVNMTFNYPIKQLYNNDSIFTNIINILYYFYLIPGDIFNSSLKLLAHIIFIIILSVIIIIFKSNEMQDVNLKYDFKNKKNINRTVNNFTLIVWIFTSMIALKL